MTRRIDRWTLFNKKVFSNIARDIFKSIGKNFICLVTSGSVQLERALPCWSDLDFIVVCRRLDFITKIKLNKLFKNIKKNFRMKVGGVAISIDELTGSKILTSRLEGKILQSLLELQHGQQKLYYFGKKTRYPIHLTLNKKQIKTFTLNEIGRILALYRRLILRSDLQNKTNLMRVIKQSINYSIIMTKLAVQYFNDITCYSDEMILEQMMEIFPKNLVRQFKKILIFKIKWPENKKIKDKLNDIDEYLETFSSYVFEKIKNKV